MLKTFYFEHFQCLFCSRNNAETGPIKEPLGSNTSQCNQRTHCWELLETWTAPDYPHSISQDRPCLAGRIHLNQLQDFFKFCTYHCAAEEEKFGNRGQQAAVCRLRAARRVRRSPRSPDSHQKMLTTSEFRSYRR